MNEIEKLEQLINTTEDVLHRLTMDIVIGCPSSMYEAFAKLSSLLTEQYQTLNGMKNSK